MPKYMVLYKSTTAPGEQMANASPDQAQEAMQLWMAWAAKTGAALVDMGSPLGLVSTVGGTADEGGRAIGGFSILEAGSKAEVEKLMNDHPHFHTPGDNAIEILEFLPIPGM